MRLLFWGLFFMGQCLSAKEIQSSVPFYKNRKFQLAAGALLMVSAIGLRYWWNKSLENNNKSNINPNETSAFKQNDFQFNAHQKQKTFLDEIANCLKVSIQVIDNSQDEKFSINSDKKVQSFFFTAVNKRFNKKGNRFIQIASSLQSKNQNVTALEKLKDNYFDADSFSLEEGYELDEQYKIKKSTTGVNKKQKISFFDYIQYRYITNDQVKKKETIQDIFLFEDPTDKNFVLLFFNKPYFNRTSNACNYQLGTLEEEFQKDSKIRANFYI